MRETFWLHSIRAPAEPARRTSAAVSWPEPPTGTGQPPSWASIVIRNPIAPLTGASGGTSACIALPSNRIRGASPSNNWPAMVLAGWINRRASRTASAVPSFSSSRSIGRTGGNGASIPSSSGALIFCHNSTARHQLSPSVGSRRANSVAVRAGSG